jgi:hypothetical protein
MECSDDGETFTLKGKGVRKGRERKYKNKELQ